MLRQDVLPKLGIYPLAQLYKADLARVISNKANALKAAKRRGTAANRLRAVLSKFCDFCEEQGAVGWPWRAPATSCDREGLPDVRGLACSGCHEAEAPLKGTRVAWPPCAGAV